MRCSETLPVHACRSVEIELSAPRGASHASAGEVVLNMEQLPLLPARAPMPSPYAELPLAAVAQVMQQLEVGNLRSMALASNRWRQALGTPAVWLAASRRAGAAQLLRAQERLTLTRGGDRTPHGWARRAVFYGAAAPVVGLYALLGATQFWGSGPAWVKADGVVNACFLGPMLSFQFGTYAVRRAQPLFARLERAAAARDERANRATQQLEFGRTCAVEVLTQAPMAPALQQAALNALKRGLLQNETDAQTVLAAFAHAVDGRDVPRLEALLRAGIDRATADLQTAPELSRRLLMLLMISDRPDLIVRLAQTGLPLDGVMHGEVSVQCLLTSRLRRHLQTGCLQEIDRYVAVLPQTTTESLFWTSQAMLAHGTAASLGDFPALRKHLQGCFEAACLRADLDAAAALLTMGCERTEAAAQQLARLSAQAVEAQDWPRLAALRERLAVSTDRHIVKLDSALFAAIAAADVAAIRALRRAGAPGKLLNARGRSMMEFAREQASSAAIDALTERL